NHFENRFVYIYSLLLQRRLLEERSNPVDDVVRSVAVSDDAIERVAYLLEIRRVLAHPVHCRGGVVDDGGDRVTHFMGDRRRELPDGCDPVRVRELHLCLMISTLAPAKVFFGLLARGQIEHKADALVLLFAECRAAKHNGHTSPVFADKLLLEGFGGSGRPELPDGARVRVAPLGWGPSRPARAARRKSGAA